MILCELCDGMADDRMNSFGWGWCSWCQHGTHNITYEDVAASYATDEYAGHNGAFAFLKRQWETNVHLLKKHIGGASVLDIGFLEGSGMAAMTDAGFNVWGFDISEAAQKKAISNGINHERLIIEPEFTGAGLHSLDAVTCREVIEHVESPEVLLMRMTATLKIGGIAQIQTPVFHPTVKFWECAQHLRCYSIGSLITIAERAGLNFVDSMLWPGGMCLTFRKQAEYVS